MSSVSPQDPQKELLLDAVAAGYPVNGKKARIVNNSTVEVEISPGVWKAVQAWAAKIGSCKIQTQD